MEFYIWQGYRCVYNCIEPQQNSQQTEGSHQPALLLVHPIGVGLSSNFWRPFIKQWAESQSKARIYNTDLLGCGDSAMPKRAYSPKDWAEQLSFLVEQVIKGPVVVVVQGALLPVAVELVSLPASQYVKGLVLSGPPAWPLMSNQTAAWKTQLAWTLLSSPLGNAFYRYARRESFLQSFSERQLFEERGDVTDDWLTMLEAGSQDMNSRYAVFSFLAGFWRQDYSKAIARIQQPVVVVMGEAASTIDRAVAKQMDASKTTADKRKRLQDYLDHFPRATGVSIPGRNVLPYESTAEFVQVVDSFIRDL
ncbi:MAG: alpha/beta fold hydrolase [Phormidesmis sp.]